MNTTKSNKSALSLIVAIMILLSIIPVNLYTSIDTNAATNGFHVSGTKILDGNNQQFVMRGVNIAHAWFKSNTETSINAIAARGGNTVRVVCSDGQQWTKTTQTELQNIISWCKDAKVICVLEVHDGTGKNDVSYLNNAANYWVEMKSVLQGNEDYVIVNIANEWYGSWNNATAWANGYKSAIATIRDAGITNMLMVDSAGYGQWPSSIFQKGTEVFNSDSLKNTVFSIHMYQDAGKNERVVKNNIDNALAINVPVVIGEFAADHAGSEVDEGTIISYCTEKKVGYLGWSWKGNGDGLESLDIAQDWQGNSLSTWGDTLFNSTYGITNTSTLCSIYTGIIDSSSEDDSSSDADSSSQPSGDTKQYTVFEGSFNLNKWTTEYPLDLTDFTSVSKIVITMAGRGQVQFNYVGYYDVVAGDNEFTNVTGFAGNVVPVKGNGTITKITVFGTKTGEEDSSSDSSSQDDSSSQSVPDTDPEYVSTNLTLSGVIGANTYYTVPDGYVNDNYKVEAVFTATGVSDITVPLDTSKTKIVDGKKTYVFTLPVKSCDMAKRFRARLYVKTKAGEQLFATSPTTITLNQYISSLANTGNEAERAFANAMQTYGYYSQKVFSGTTPSGITPIDLSDVTASTLRKYASSTDTIYDITKKGEIYGTTLYLDSGTRIRSYVKDLNNVDTNNLYMKYTLASGKGEDIYVKAQYSAEKNAYYGEIPDVPADKLSTKYVICFCEGTRPITDVSVTYCAFSYVYSTLKGATASADEINLAKALYKYGMTAEVIEG